MAKSPDEMVADMMAGLKEKSGKDLAEWKAVIEASGLQKHGEIVSMLKTEHGLGHGYANMIVHVAKESHAAAVSQHTDLEAEWFAGDKAALRPMYDRIMAIIRGFGNDIEESPKKAYMSLRRNKQFACVGPGSKTRIDLQVQLKGHAATERLEEQKGGMTSHKVKINSLEEIDEEVQAWLRQAYDAC
jgi:predicted transport protein